MGRNVARVDTGVYQAIVERIVTAPRNNVSFTNPDNSAACPECGSEAITKIHSQWHCQICGRQWGPVLVGYGPSRRDICR